MGNNDKNCTDGSVQNVAKGKFKSRLGLGQTSLFSCAEPNVNEEKSLF